MRKESRTRIDFRTREHYHVAKWKFCRNQASGTERVTTVEPSITREVCWTSLHDTGTSTTVQLRLHPRPGTAPLHWVRRSHSPVPPHRNVSGRASKTPCRSPRSPCCRQCHTRRHRTLTLARPGKCRTRATSSGRSPCASTRPQLRQ